MAGTLGARGGTNLDTMDRYLDRRERSRLQASDVLGLMNTDAANRMATRRANAASALQDMQDRHRLERQQFESDRNFKEDQRRFDLGREDASKGAAMAIQRDAILKGAKLPEAQPQVQNRMARGRGVAQADPFEAALRMLSSGVDAERARQDELIAIDNAHKLGLIDAETAAKEKLAIIGADQSIRVGDAAALNTMRGEAAKAGLTTQGETVSEFGTNMARDVSTSQINERRRENRIRVEKAMLDAGKAGADLSGIDPDDPLVFQKIAIKVAEGQKIIREAAAQLVRDGYSHEESMAAANAARMLQLATAQTGVETGDPAYDNLAKGTREQEKRVADLDAEKWNRNRGADLEDMGTAKSEARFQGAMKIAEIGGLTDEMLAQFTDQVDQEMLRAINDAFYATANANPVEGQTPRVSRLSPRGGALSASAPQVNTAGTPIANTTADPYALLRGQVLDVVGQYGMFQDTPDIADGANYILGLRKKLLGKPLTPLAQRQLAAMDRMLDVLATNPDLLKQYIPTFGFSYGNPAQQTSGRRAFAEAAQALKELGINFD